MEKKYQIRLEKPQDYRRVENLTREAFWNLHVPGCDEHYLAKVLRDSSEFISELDFVMEVDGQIIGNIMYTNAVIKNEQGEDFQTLTFGPVSIHPHFQGQGLGSILIKHSLTRAKELGYKLVVIYGDPDYYSRFGFLQGERFDIYSNDGFYNPALQVLELVPGALNGVSGSFIEDKAYHIDSRDVSKFEATFPPKEKMETKSQIKFRDFLEKARKR